MLFFSPREDLLCENHFHHEEPMLVVVETKPQRKLARTPPKDLLRVVNLGQFKPEEVQVSLNENILTLSGSHKEESDGSSFEATFTKKILIPDGIDRSTINAKIDEKGHLEITGKAEKKKEAGSIQIPINILKENLEAKENGKEMETGDGKAN